MSCGSSEISTSEDKNLSIPPEAKNQSSEQNDFLIEGIFSDSSEFRTLSEVQMSCVVDKLLEFFTPEQVSGVIDAGPTLEQKEVALSALEICNLLVTVANLGIVEGVVDSFGTFPNDTDCVLSTVREKALFPILEVLLSDIDSKEMSERVEALLLDSRILDFLISCVLDAEFDHCLLYTSPSPRD